MKAIVVSTPGDPSAMEYRSTDAPAAQPGEVVVDVAAAGVNFIDVYHRSGQYPLDTPFTLGLEGAGTVSQVGFDVEDVRVGDRVAWMQGSGSYAQKVALPADKTVPVPEGVDLETAAAAMLQGITAHSLVYSTYVVQPEDTVVIHAAAGGVGLLLTQMVARRGATVLATASTAQKRQRARDAGADHACEYAMLKQAVDEHTGYRGVDVVYDGVGIATFEDSIAALRPRGTMVLYGQSSGAVAPLDPQILARNGSLYLTRPLAFDYISDRHEFLRRTHDLFEWVANGELDIHVGHTYSLEDAPRAHADLEARRTSGKVLLLP